MLEEVLAAGRRLNAYAADDAHFKSPDAAGGWVMVKAEKLEPELLLEALKQGDYYSSQGPEIHDIVVDGDKVKVACSPAAWVSVAGPAPARTAATARSCSAPHCRSNASARAAGSASP